MRLALFIFLIVITIPCTTYAADSSAEQGFRSFLSTSSCKQMITGLQSKVTQKEYFVMVGSFITGSNYAKSRDSKIDLKGMMLVTEQFCRQNPDLSVTAALLSLDQAIDRRNALEIKSQKVD